jgi:hypothetical protein
MARWNNPDGTRMTCQIPACDLPIRTRGVCNAHYQSRIKSGLMDTTPVNWGSPSGRIGCSELNCPEDVLAKGVCHHHYHKVYRASVTEKEMSRESLVCAVSDCGRGVKDLAELCTRCSRKRWSYSLELEEFLEMNKPENRVCQNRGCEIVVNLHIDHDHACCPDTKSAKRSCGKCVRGWLCNGCNIALGILQDDRKRIAGLLEYLGDN